MTEQNYPAKEIEKKWQDKWDEQNLYTTANEAPGKENLLVLSEFSYPSGNLHVGHWYAFALPDMYARFKRMQGYNVLYPTGFDAFGLPAENAAIKRGVDPQHWTWEHMDFMRAQLRSMGPSFDWSREVVTADPAYYRFTQWMFNQFYKNDLVYRDITKVNWCEHDKTILANEQVTNGSCERCGNKVIQKDMQQWMLRITSFADDLIDSLDTLPWDHAIKQSQREWIGRKEGSVINFEIQGMQVPVFTTRVDTIYGVSYLVLAPEHSLVNELKDSIQNWDEVQNYLAEVQAKSDLDRQQSTEKTGVILEGVLARHPLTGEALPVWIADYVLAHFGTGVVMAVPAHDERDFEFAQKFNLGIHKVIDAPDASENSLPYTEKGILVDSGEFTGTTSDEAIRTITEKLNGKMTTTYRLRDWGISRQRYWGCPIPMVYDPQGNPYPVPDEHLPWTLPTDVDHTPDGTAPLARSQELFERTERIFGKGWTPEVDTMDTFVDSSWYFYRYLDAHNNDVFAGMEAMRAWMPVATYFGGAEHTTMHLLYSRFWTKALASIGLVEDKEPYRQRFNRGLILGPDGQKMSKSKGNVIDPDEVVKHVGADTVRCYLAFIGPFNEPGNYPWDPNGVVGIRRFLDRFWRLQTKVSDTSSSTEWVTELHRTIKKVGDDIERLKYNTAISSMMVLLNKAEKETSVSRTDYESMIQLLSPFAPHLAEELWLLVGNTESVHLTSWPSYDEKYLVQTSFTLGVQVNGKVRGTIEISADATADEVQKLALENPQIARWVEDKQVTKFIYIPQKIVNIIC
jgi:leucyl-tRNA synthetase